MPEKLRLPLTISEGAARVLRIEATATATPTAQRTAVAMCGPCRTVLPKTVSVQHMGRSLHAWCETCQEWTPMAFMIDEPCTVDAKCVVSFSIASSMRPE